MGQAGGLGTSGQCSLSSFTTSQVTFLLQPSLALGIPSLRLPWSFLSQLFCFIGQAF